MMALRNRVAAHAGRSSATASSSKTALDINAGSSRIRSNQGDDNAKILGGLRNERDKRTMNREKAEAMDPGTQVSRQLMKCRTTVDFIQFARKHGAEVVINSNHVKVSNDGVTTGFHSIGKKEAMPNSVLKQKIEAFKAMGIAWDK